MIGDAWASLFGKVTDVIGKAVPDKSKAQELTAQIMDALTTSNAQQAAMTQQEGASSDKFKSWWRPALAWLCVLGFALQFLALPIAQAVILVQTGKAVAFSFGADALNNMLYALLGLGGMRTMERMAGKA